VYELLDRSTDGVCLEKVQFSEILMFQ
jgi:hypothetical protein